MDGRAVSRETGMPVTYAMLQSIAKEMTWTEQMQATKDWNAKGANIVAQIALRGTGIIDGVARHGASVPLQAVMGRDRDPALGRAAGAPQGPGVQGADARRGQCVSRVDVIELLYAVALGGTTYTTRWGEFNYEPTPGRNHRGSRRRQRVHDRGGVYVRPADGGRGHRASSISRSSTTPTATSTLSKACWSATTR